VLSQLLASLANDEISFAKLAQLIEKDTILAGNVLRVVNSALYGCRGTVSSVAHAISIMGLGKLRNTALGFSVSRALNSIKTPKWWSTKRFNTHSLAVGILADEIAQRVPTSYPEGAFVAGLFHDLGKLLLATSMASEYEEIAKHTAASDSAIHEIELVFLGITHAEVSAAALEKWNLPKPVQIAALHHHTPDHTPAADRGTHPFHLAHVVQSADAAAIRLGISLDIPKECDADLSAVEPFSTLGIAENHEAILRDFREEFSTLNAIL
jgi:putative nucleotidyltransferase with HDIG domain